MGGPNVLYINLPPATVVGAQVSARFDPQGLIDGYIGVAVVPNGADTINGDIASIFFNGSGQCMTFIVGEAGDWWIMSDGFDGTAGGDLSGYYPNPYVVKLQNRSVDSAPPVDGYALTWNDGTSQWESLLCSSLAHSLGGSSHIADTLANLNSKVSDADLISDITVAAGDLSGFYPNPTVIKLQGRIVSSAGPTDGYSLTWNNVDSKWEPKLGTPAAHALGGVRHTADTLANLNLKISDADLISDITAAGGDLSGTYPNPTVVKLQTRNVESGAPTDGYGLTWDTGSSTWISDKPIPGGAAAGDLSGTYPKPVVAKLQTRDVDSGTPTDGYALTWSTSGSKWLSSKPIPGGTAGGNLSGTYPNPSVASLDPSLLSAYQSASAPGLNNDRVDSAGIGREFFVGNLWLDTTVSPGVLYFCYIDTATAAIWGIIGNIAVPTINDKNLICSVTASDYDKATVSTVTTTPTLNGYVQVMLNGIQQPVGDGVRTKNCYFSGDNGTTARAIIDIQAGDTCHWVGSVVGHQLAVSDIMDWNYVVAQTGVTSAPTAAYEMSVEIVEASQPSALLANNVRYTPLIKGNTDWIQFQILVPPSTISLKVHVYYHMSAANGGNVELHLDRRAFSASSDPAAALTGGTEFVVTPGNDTLMHVLDNNIHASMEIAVSPGDLLVCKLQRTADAQDTHTADMRITSISAEV